MQIATGRISFPRHKDSGLLFFDSVVNFGSPISKAVVVLTGTNFGFSPRDDHHHRPIRVVHAKDGVARLELLTYGAFTVGAIADDGATLLELDLSADPRFPKKLREGLRKWGHTDDASEYQP